MAVNTGFNLGLDLNAAQADFMNDFGPKGSTAENDIRWMNDFAWKQSLRNEQFQQDLANHGIKMRVDDAVRAGLHPLVGAGINPASGGWSGPAFNQPQPKQQMGGGGASMGVNISRAVDATRSPEERELMALQLENARADTARSQAERDIANLELQRMRLNPPMPNPEPYSPTGAHAASMKYYGNQIFGEPARPFWDSVGRNAGRLLAPLKKLDYRDWR